MLILVGSYNLERKLFSDVDSMILFLVIYGSGVEIPSAKTPGPLNFLVWGQIFVGPQYGTCFISHFWGLKILSWFQDFWKSCANMISDLFNKAVGSSVYTVSDKWGINWKGF
jgi:hypothetical protein